MLSLAAPLVPRSVSEAPTGSKEILGPHLLVITIGVVLIVAAGAIIVGLSASGGNGENGGLAVAVNKVSLDRVDAPNGSAFYVMDLNASNEGSGVWHLDPSMFRMASNSSTYSPNTGYNRTVLMGRLDVVLGRSATGRVVFEVPTKEVPVNLSYTDKGAGININVPSIPPVTSVASKFEFYVHLSVTGTGPWVQSVISYGAVDDLNNSLVYFTGQRVEVGFTLQYYKQPVDPQKIFVRSISSDQGFVLAGGPSFPLLMSGWGTQADPLLFFVVSPGQHSGKISFTVQLST